MSAFLLTGPFGYESIYGELPEFKLKTNPTQSIPLVPSERPWETIFSGSSHNLPSLTKLCSVFLESLLEKRPAVLEWIIHTGVVLHFAAWEIQLKVIWQTRSTASFFKAEKEVVQVDMQIQSHSMMGIIYLSMQLGQRGQQQKGV